MKKAVLDACVLYPVQLRDVLLSIASEGCFEPHWSDQINDEWKRNLLVDRKDLKPEQLERTIITMNEAFEGACLSGFEGLIDKIELPDLDDRHVVAAAIHNKSTYIITNNLKDFPADQLKRWSVVAKSPEDFIEELIVADDLFELIIKALADQRARMKNPPMDVSEFVEGIKKQGLTKLAARLQLRTSDL